MTYKKIMGNSLGKKKLDLGFVDRRAVVGWSWDPLCFLQIYRSINDTVQAIFVGVSVLMGKWPENGLKMTIFKNVLKTHPKVVNA